MLPNYKHVQGVFYNEYAVDAPQCQVYEMEKPSFAVRQNGEIFIYATVEAVDS